MVAPKRADVSADTDGGVEADADAELDKETVELYKGIKDELIKRGVKAEEIALIQDYKNSDKKKDLFEDMNEGRVRILIGGTTSMGVGMNAQKRMIALHHLDAPATQRPGDVTQREGRIIRQGNTNPEVGIYTYVTVGTFDTRMWGNLEKKARFIGQLMNGDGTIDSIEDIGDEALTFAEIKGIASGNPDIMRQAEIENQAAQLRTLRTAHFRNVQSARVRAEETREEIAAAEITLKAAREDVKKLVDVSGGKFKAVIGRATFTDRSDAGNAVIKAASAVKNGKEKIGTFGGLNVEVNDKGTAWLTGEGSYWFEINKNSAAGTIQSAAAALKKVTETPAKMTERIEKLKADAAEYEKQSKAVFSRQGELDALEEENTALLRKLKGEDDTEVDVSDSDTSEGGGAGVKFSLARENGRDVVIIDEDILDGVPKKDWAKTVAQTLINKFSDGVKVGDNLIKVNVKTRREMTYSEYTKWLKKQSPDVYMDKLRTANNIDEILIASKNYVNEGLKHGRTDNITQFARGEVLLRVGYNDYTADVIVGYTNAGNMALYDIVNYKNGRAIQPNLAESYRSDASAMQIKDERAVPPNHKESDRQGASAVNASAVTPVSARVGFSRKGATTSETGVINDSIRPARTGVSPKGATVSGHNIINNSISNSGENVNAKLSDDGDTFKDMTKITSAPYERAFPTRGAASSKADVIDNSISHSRENINAKFSLADDLRNEEAKAAKENDIKKVAKLESDRYYLYNEIIMKLENAYHDPDSDFSAEEKTIIGAILEGAGNTDALNLQLKTLMEKHGLAKDVEDGGWSLPKKVDDSGKYVSQAAVTIGQSDGTAAETRLAMEEMTVKGVFSQTVEHNEERIAAAKAKFAELRGKALRDEFYKWRSDRGGLEHDYDGIALYDRLMATGEQVTAAAIIPVLVKESAEAGRALQMRKLWKLMTPYQMTTYFNWLGRKFEKDTGVKVEVPKDIREKVIITATEKDAETKKLLELEKEYDTMNAEYYKMQDKLNADTSLWADLNDNIQRQNDLLHGLLDEIDKARDEVAKTEAELEKLTEKVRTLFVKSAEKALTSGQRFIAFTTAWRYFSMLSNPKTHVFNVLANMFFMPVVSIRNRVAEVIEKELVREGKLDANQRTKATFADKEYRDFATQYVGKVSVKDFFKTKIEVTDKGSRKVHTWDAWETSTEIRKIMSGHQKYDDGSTSDIYKPFVLNELIKWALSNEDMIFKSGHFKRAMASALARGALIWRGLSSGKAGGYGSTPK